MKIAYLVNQYPKVSHSFIRREIQALETIGLEIIRYSIRSCGEELVDEADRQEQGKTRVLLDLGTGLLWAILRVFFARPQRWLSAFRLTLKIGWGSDRGVLRNLAYLVEACALLEQCQALEITHIHAHFGTNPAAVAMLCQVLGGPNYSFTVHGPEEFDKVLAIALPEKIKRAAFVVAVSSYGKSQLYRWCEFEQWSKIRVVHCGVDNLFLETERLPVPTAPRLVCVGRLCEQKGQLLLLEAAARLAAEGLDFKLVFVGDGPLRGNIEAAIARLGLTNKLEITGWASSVQVQQQILASQTLVLPSFAEGLPVVLMEALALGRPVISTYVAGIPELVESEVCGWLVPPGSVEALVEAIRTALRLPATKLEQMGRVGARRVAKEHNAVWEARKLAALFQPNRSLANPVTTPALPERVS